MIRLLLQELRSRRNGIIGWSIGLSLLPAIYVAIYPQFQDDLAGMQDILDLEIYKAMGMNFGTFEDWLASTIINLVPIILAIYAVLDGTGTLAGEEDSGKLEIVVALPIPRWQIVTVKAIAHAIGLFLILLIVDVVTTFVFVTIESDIQTTLTTWDVFWSLLYLWPIVLAFGMISLFLGAFAPSRRVAALIATVVVIVSYFGNNLSSQVSTLETLKPFFLYNYLDATATLWVDGPNPGDVLVLLGVSLVAFILAVLFFQRRNITVGVWPWQRGKLPREASQTA